MRGAARHAQVGRAACVERCTQVGGDLTLDPMAQWDSGESHSMAGSGVLSLTQFRALGH